MWSVLFPGVAARRAESDGLANATESQRSPACDAVEDVADEHHTRLHTFHDQEGEHQIRQLIFPDRVAMKESLRKQVIKPEYNVAIYYHERGIYQWIARHPWFEKLTLCVISANAIWIAVDTDHNKASMLLEAAPVYQVFEHTFCIYFAFEWTMRFLSFKRKRDALRDAWFGFDSVLVFSMVIETWLMTAIVLASGRGGADLGNSGILRIARLLRLSRMARMVRLLRAMPELLILMKAMMAALRSVVFVLGLLFAIIYVFAIAFTQLCDGTDCGAIFSSVPVSMNILFEKGALIDNLSDLTDPLKNQNIGLLALFYLYVFLAFLTVINMLTGVIVEVVTSVAASEKELLTVTYVKERIQELMNQCADADGDNMISKKEFMSLLNNQKATAILHNVGVDVVGLVDFADTIFENNEEVQKRLSFEEFMEVILDLRGFNKATVRDIVELRKFVDGRIASLQYHLLESTPLNQRTGRMSSPLGEDNLLGKQHGTALELEVASKLQHLINQSLKEIVDIHQHEVSALRAESCKLRAELIKVSDRMSFRSKSRETLTHSEGHATASSDTPVVGEWTPLPPEARWLGQQCSDGAPPSRAERLLENSMLDGQQLTPRDSMSLPSGPPSQPLGAGQAFTSAVVHPYTSRAPWQWKGLEEARANFEPIIGKRASNNEL